jgi:hypothetical protein
MDFYATLDQVVELLRSRGRVSYRALKEQFGLHDQRLDAIRVELLYAHAHDVQADEQGFVWTPRDSNPADAERRPAEVYRINGNCFFARRYPTRLRRNAVSERRSPWRGTTTRSRGNCAQR